MDFKMFVKILDRHEKMRLEKEIQKDKEANNLLTDTEKLSEKESYTEQLIMEVNKRYRAR
tara:strand:- start:45 stop:224 length:180 start_codon:yes stop_codon:yes gene_type:complete